MKCSINNKALNRKLEYERGVSSGVDSMLIMFTYVLSRYGYKGPKIQQMVKSIEDIADSINRGYVTHQDLEDVLWEEYGIKMHKRKQWLMEERG